MRRTDSLFDRISALRVHHGPLGDSSFTGITGNLGFILGFFDTEEHPDYLRTHALLAAYVSLVERGHPDHPDFVHAEMCFSRGYLPDSFPTGSHPEPHHAYIAEVCRRLGSSVDL